MAKIYKTAKGKTLNMAALIAKNEGVRAVGNMNVNARGDEIDSKNQPIKTRQQTVQAYYKKQVTAPVAETPVNPQQAAVKALTEDNIPTPVVAQPVVEPVVFPDDVIENDETENQLTDPVMDAVSKLDAVDQPLQPLADVVEQLQAPVQAPVAPVTSDPAPTSGLAAAIQKIKDNKSLKG